MDDRLIYINKIVLKRVFEKSKALVLYIPVFRRSTMKVPTFSN